MSEVQQPNRDALVVQVNTIIADLDRARANGTVYTYGNIQERLRNALHFASRRPEAAPSDTDLRELIDVIADRLGEHPKAGNVFDITDEATTMIRLDEGVEVLAEFIAPALVSLLSRASQPVQVEVTDDMVEKAWNALIESATDVTTKDDLRAALSAALGGGDHAE